MKFYTYLKRYVLAFILLLAAALRLYHCDFQSIWLDEVLTMNAGNPKLSLREFYDSIMFWEFIPHLYFFLNRILFSIFGYTTLVARVFSAIIGVGGVYAIYLLGKSIFNRNAGLIAALLLSVNFFHISHSQEIRPYGLLFMFSVLSFYRLIEFLKAPSAKHAIYYGIFAGLMLNAHFFGLITLFSQCLIVLGFMIITSKDERAKFFKFLLMAGGSFLVIFAPAIQPFIRVSKISSFWLERPGPEAFSKMFREFFGSSEMVLFFVQFVIIYYAIHIFKVKITDYNYKSIINNKLLFGFIILFVWLFTSITIPFLRSYLDVPMILNRYFINILAAILLIITIGICLINNRMLKITVLSCMVFFSITDLFAVKKYYSTITKTQYRELTKNIIKRNSANSKIVTYWGWIFPYFFYDNPEIKVEGNSLEDYVTGMKNGSITLEPFWYADANARTYILSPENQAYLDENFRLSKKLEYYDAWANYYVPKKINNVVDLNTTSNILSTFAPANFAEDGSMQLFENGTVTSVNIKLAKGKYNVILNGYSTPNRPVKNENSHIVIKFAGKQIGSIYLSENQKTPKNIIPVEYSMDTEGKFEIIFDNDLSYDNKDRNLVITSLRIIKQ